MQQGDEATLLEQIHFYEKIIAERREQGQGEQLLTKGVCTIGAPLAGSVQKTSVKSKFQHKSELHNSTHTNSPNRYKYSETVKQYGTGTKSFTAPSSQRGRVPGVHNALPNNKYKYINQETFAKKLNAKIPNVQYSSHYNPIFHKQTTTAEKVKKTRYKLVNTGNKSGQTVKAQPIPQKVTPNASQSFKSGNTANTSSWTSKNHELSCDKSNPTRVLSKYKLIERIVPSRIRTNSTVTQVRHMQQSSQDTSITSKTSLSTVTRHRIIRRQVSADKRAIHSPKLSHTCRRTISVNRKSPGLSVMLKSRYKLVKKAITSTHNITAKRRSSTVSTPTPSQLQSYNINLLRKHASTYLMQNFRISKYKLQRYQNDRAINRQGRYSANYSKTTRLKIDKRTESERKYTSAQRCRVLKGFSKHISHNQSGFYLLTRGGKSLRKISIPTAASDKPATFVARNAVIKSRYAQYHYQQKKIQSATQRKACLYFSRFGRCSKGAKCTYVHDPKKVAICTRFLRGTCQVQNCPFSHNVSKEKMPVCSYYLKGFCKRENCPYLHVNVGATADLCMDFIEGFCPSGEQCSKRHIQECPEYKTNGSCSLGRKCPLKHKKKIVMKKTSKPPQQPEAARAEANVDEAEDDTSLPMKQRRLPAYISVSSRPRDVAASQGITVQGATANTRESPLKIRPNLSLKK